jgi:prepilin-type N-terminal cleavage/methylation domain-containing protein
MLKKQNQKGFTIIEVLIVLAIAALIMLVVFLAVPALQRSQRNNARAADANLLVAAVNDCITNRNGQVDSCQAASADSVVIPTNPQQITAGMALSGQTKGTAANATTGNGTTTTATWQTGVKCSDDGLTTVVATKREFAVRYQAETNGGGSTNRCISS